MKKHQKVFEKQKNTISQIRAKDKNMSKIAEDDEFNCDISDTPLKESIKDITHQEVKKTIGSTDLFMTSKLRKPQLDMRAPKKSISHPQKIIQPGHSPKVQEDRVPL